jgi:serine/threonine protein phosphatase PrpC
MKIFNRQRGSSLLLVVFVGTAGSRIAPLQTAALSTPATTTTVPNISALPRILLPRDVYFDRETREQLDIISESYADDENGQQNDDSSQESQQRRRQAKNNKNAAALQTLSSSGNADRVTLTMTGYKGTSRFGMEDQINQDRALIVNPLLVSSPLDSSTTVSPSLLVGVLDGHGDPGHRVSEFARVQLEQRLTAALQRDLLLLAADADADQNTRSSANNNNNNNNNNQSSAASLLKNTTYISNLLTNLIEQVNRDVPAPHGIHGGSTVSLVLQLGQHIYLINAGDSLSFIAATATIAIPTTSPADNTVNGDTATATSPAMKTATVILQTTVADKPGRPDERARILAAGGVLEQQHENDENARLSYYIGTAEYSLAMSRCLGDHPAIGLIATPTIQVFTIPELLAQATDLLRDKLLLQTQTTTNSNGNDDDDDEDYDENEDEQHDANFQPLHQHKPQQRQEAICVDTDDSNNIAGECRAASIMSGSTPSDIAIDPINDIHLFAISATDGLVDFVHSQQIADKMGRALFLAARTTTTATSSSAAAFTFAAAEQLILLAANRWQHELKGKYRDDIAIAVATLYPPPPPPPPPPVVFPPSNR